MNLSSLRSALAPALRPVCGKLAILGTARRKGRYFRHGIEGIAMELRGAIDCVPILREYGAHVGAGTTVFGPLQIMNADRDFSNLWLGDHVFIGTDVIFDLADRVRVGDGATISMRCTIVTHVDVGDGPLKAARPPEKGPVVMEGGSYLGTGVTLLHGVTVGALATVGAGCLVRKDVPPGATLVVPAIDVSAS